MKFKYILFVSIVVTSYTLQAQFGGLNKLKDKAKDATSKDGSSGKGTKVDASKLDRSDPANSPAQESIYNFRSEMSSAENAVNKGYNNVEEYFAKIEKLLAKIKSEDPGWPDYEKDEARYKELKAKHETEAGSLKYYNLLFDITNTAEGVKNRSLYDLLSPTTAKHLSKASFDEVKVYYNANQDEAKDNVKSNIAFMEKFHAEKMPALKKEVLEFIDNDYVKKTTQYLKSNRTKADYIKKIGHGSTPNPKSDIQKINEGLEHSEQAVVLFSGDVDITAQNKALKNAKADLELYAKSDDLKNDIELRKKQDFEEILLQKPEMKDAGMDAIVKRDFDTKEWGVIKRISLVSSGWQIRKNSVGIPLEKYINVEACSGKDGKCWRSSGTIISVYEGGGVYGKAKYYPSSSIPMNCDNVNKNLEDLDK